MSACAYSPACSACCTADTRPPTSTARAPTSAYAHDLLFIGSPPSFSITVGDALQDVPRWEWSHKGRPEGRPLREPPHRDGLTRDALKGSPTRAAISGRSHEGRPERASPTRATGNTNHENRRGRPSGRPTSNRKPS